MSNHKFLGSNCQTVKLLWGFLCLAIVLFSTDTLAQQNGYYNQTEAGVLIGKYTQQYSDAQESRTGFSFSSFNGIHLLPKHVVGISVGLDRYLEADLIPIAFGWRYFLGEGNGPKLFLGADLGGASSILEKKETTDWSKTWYIGGLLVYPSVGVSFPLQESKTAFVVSLGYKYQRLSHFVGLIDPSGTSHPGLPPGLRQLTETSYRYHSLSIKAGLLF